MTLLSTTARLAAAAGLSLLLMACEPNNRGYEPAQPIAYSHKVHAGDLAIPCQYCHYASRHSRHAGIPPASICMNCHKYLVNEEPEVQKFVQARINEEPIHWVRVHRLPDHAFFDHSAHVHGGLECQECHGPVETMEVVRQFAPLSMGWCLDCHRKGGDPTAEERVQTPLTECNTCHH